jgi:hypothetical protein
VRKFEIILSSLNDLNSNFNIKITGSKETKVHCGDNRWFTSSGNEEKLESAPSKLRPATDMCTIIKGEFWGGNLG